MYFIWWQCGFIKTIKVEVSERKEVRYGGSSVISESMYITVNGMLVEM